MDMFMEGEDGEAKDKVDWRHRWWQ